MDRLRVPVANVDVDNLWGVSLIANRIDLIDCICSNIILLSTFERILRLLILLEFLFYFFGKSRINNQRDLHLFFVT